MTIYPSRCKNPVIKKSYHKLGKTLTFQRHGWWLIENPHLVLVHCLGDETEYKPTPHGNSKNSSTEYIRTCPSVIKDIADKSTDSSATVYQKLASAPCDPELNAVLRPRNLKQVQNVNQTINQSKRLSRDDYYNLMLIAHDLKDYVFEIVTYPDLTCFVGLSEILKEFNNILHVQTADSTLILSYDTTFNLGDFYVTPIVFRHVMFENSPCIPLAFMFHQKKYQSLHEDFLRILCRRVPNFKRCKVPTVTDREVGIMNAIKDVLPQAQLLLCWNHFKQDLRRWLRSHGANQQCPMKTYFDSHLKQDLTSYAGKWILQPLHLYTPHSGITNNISESMNAVLKRLMDWKEVPVDSAVLSFCFLQNYYHNEMLRGMCTTGQYRLRPHFANCSQDPSNIDFKSDIISPQDIIDRIREINVPDYQPQTQEQGLPETTQSQTSSSDIPDITDKEPMASERPSTSIPTT